MDCSPPGSSVHGVLHARILEWIAISFSRGSSPPRDQTHVFYVWCTGRKVLYHQHHLSPRQLSFIQVVQAGIKIARRNINNLSYADDITLIAESEEELKSLLMKVKEESEKVVLKLNIQKTKIMASGPITSWRIDGETVETVTDFIFEGLQNHCRWWLQPWN